MVLSATTLRQLPVTGKKYQITCELHPGLCVQVSPSGRQKLLFRYKSDGKQVETRLFGKNFEEKFELYKKLYKQRLRQEKAQGARTAAAKASPKPADSIFNDDWDLPLLLDAFLERHVKVHLTPETHRQYISHIDRTLREITGTELYYGRANLQEARLTIKEVLLDVRETAPVNCNRIRTTLSSAFSWGVEEDIVKDNPVFKMPSAREYPKQTLLLGEEITKFLRVTGDSQFDRSSVLGLWLILLTGLRSGEVRAIRPSMVDFEGRRLTFPITKNQRPHMVPLSDLAIDILMELSEQTEGDNYLVPTSVYGLRQVCRRACKRATVTICCPHDLRRSCATLAGSLAVPSETISRLLNHVQPGVTFRHYNLYDHEKEKRAGLELVAQELKRLGMEIPK